MLCQRLQIVALQLIYNLPKILNSILLIMLLQHQYAFEFPILVDLNQIENNDELHLKHLLLDDMLLLIQTSNLF